MKLSHLQSDVELWDPVEDLLDEEEAAGRLDVEKAEQLGRVFGDLFANVLVALQPGQDELLNVLYDLFAKDLFLNMNVKK